MGTKGGKRELWKRAARPRTKRGEAKKNARIERAAGKVLEFSFAIGEAGKGEKPTCSVADGVEKGPYSHQFEKKGGVVSASGRGERGEGRKKSPLLPKSIRGTTSAGTLPWEGADSLFRAHSVRGKATPISFREGEKKPGPEPYLSLGGGVRRTNNLFSAG